MINDISITIACYKDDLVMYARFILATLECLRLPLPEEERKEGLLVLDTYVSKFNSMAEFVIELS